MSQPPPSDHGNVVDPDVLASRRARRAEVSEDASLELRLFEAERRLGEVAAERDALRAALEAGERDLRATRQREWAEQQQRLEAQGEAAATRDLAAGRIARLRERLAAAEAEVGVVAAERDRARAALERERAAAAVDRERVAALQREHAALRAQVGAAREVEARLVAERGTFAEQVAAVERAVAAVRDRLGAAVAGLREALAAERSARVAAEARVGTLERELARQAEVEAQLRSALDGLRGELAAVRAGDGARVAALASRVQGVMAVAAGLRDGAARDRDAETQALSVSLQAMQARVQELTARVAEAGAAAREETGAIREELEAERAARWVAEAELDAERERAVADRAARAEAEARLAAVEAELEELRAAPPGDAPAPVVDSEALASLRETLAGLQAARETSAPAPSLGLDLAAAAERLRSLAEPLTPVAAPAASRDDSCGDERHESSLDDVVEAPAPVAPVAPPAPAEPERHPLPSREPVGTSGPWLRDALGSLAADEPDIAELLLVALLPAQAGLAKRPLAYDLVITGGGTHRVAIEEDRARVESPGAPADATVSGPLQALVPLAAGGAGRRLPGATVEGRRHLRRLLKVRRAPVALADLAAAGATPSPGLLLTVLARAVPARWTAGKPLAVDVAVRGADRWRVLASGEGPLLILPASPEDPAPSTLHVAAGRLAAVLAGTATADDAHVEGDPAPVRTLLGWLDRAQRVR